MIPVVAIALIDSSSRVLMQRRRLTGAHGGLWEFPGGKVEVAESPESALVREVSEELGVRVETGALAPLAFASRPDDPYVVLLYTCRDWQGEPVCLDGEEIGWFEPGALMALEMPPLDVPLAMSVKELLEKAN